MFISRTTAMVIISILVHVGIFAGIGGLIYVFGVKFPESIEKKEKDRKERLWLSTAVEEIKNADGTIESRIRIKMPESILREATNATNTLTPPTGKKNP